MDIEKINIANYVASLKLEGIDKIKQDLKEIEETLDKVLYKYEKMAELGEKLQEQPEEKFIPQDSDGDHCENYEKCKAN